MRWNGANWYDNESHVSARACWEVESNRLKDTSSTSSTTSNEWVWPRRSYCGPYYNSGVIRLLARNGDSILEWLFVVASFFSCSTFSVRSCFGPSFYPLPPRKVHERTGKFKIGGWREGRLGPDVVMSSQGIGPVEAAYLNLILCGDWSSNHRRNWLVETSEDRSPWDRHTQCGYWQGSKPVPSCPRYVGHTSGCDNMAN